MSNVINVSIGFTDLLLVTAAKYFEGSIADEIFEFRQKLCNGVDVNANGEGVGPGCATPYKYTFNAWKISLPDDRNTLFTMVGQSVKHCHKAYSFLLFQLPRPRRKI